MQNKKIFLNFLIALFIVSVGLFFGSQNCQADSITYDQSANKITITGYTEAVPCTFSELHTQDKAGTLDLFSGTPAINITLTTQIKPSDETALKINFILASSGAGVGDTIDITGTDKDGNAQNEILTTTADGTFTTTKWYKTITDVDCNGFNAGSLTIRQNQWGVVWKNENQFYFEAQIYWGDGSTDTYFADDGKQIIFKAGINSHRILNNGHLNLGKVKTANSKTTQLGCDLIFQDVSGAIIGLYGKSGSEVNLYGCSFTALNTRTLLRLEGSGNIWNNHWKKYIAVWLLGRYGNYDVYNLVASEGNYCINTPYNAVFNKIHITEYERALYILDPPSDLTIKNLYGRQNIQISAAANSPNSYSIFLVDADIDNWVFLWRQLAENVFYRQYTFNLKVIDKDNNPIGGATVVLKDKDGNISFTNTTTANGTIDEQTVSYGYYNQANGNTLQSYSPHTMTISHQDYPSKEFKFTIDKKQNLTIALKDRPMSVGSIKVWGTEYADDEAGTIYAQVFYGDGSPCNTVASADITATVYKSDNSVIINGAQMSYVADSNGIYKYNFSGGTFSAEGVYII